MDLLKELKNLEEETKGKEMTASNFVKMILLALELNSNAIQHKDIKLLDGRYLKL